MSNFFTLTKVFFLSGFNVNKKKKNQRSAFALLGLTLLLFAFSSTFLSNMFFNQFKEAKIDITLCLGMFVFIAMIMNFVISMFQLGSVLFNTKDFEFLESLPVSKACIVGSKLTATILINMAEDLALVIPAVIVYYVKGGAITPGLITILASVFASFVPILLSTIIGVAAALLSARSKYANIINIVVYLLFFISFFAGYLYLVYSGPTQMVSVIDNIFFINWINTAILGREIFVLYFILFNIGALLIVTLLVAFIYRPVNTWMKAGGVHVDYDKVKKDFKTDLNLNRVLLKKEWLLVYRKPAYLINTILGEFFFLILSLTFLLLPSFFVTNAKDLEQEMPIIAAVFASLIPGMGIMMNSIASCASTSVSMEGKFGIEMLKTYPIDSRVIIWAKIKVALYIEMILNFFVSTVIFVVMLIKGYNDVCSILAVYLYPQFAGATLVFAGILIGLKWPKLEFSNDAQVYKNSAAANLPMLFVFIPSILLVIGLTFLQIYSYEYPFLKYVGFGGACVIYMVALASLIVAINKKAPALFNNIIK